MSKPKKSGTDLAALKARLAKKTKGADAPPADVPPPGQVSAPAPEVPPPGHVSAPEVPPPGHVSAPEVPPPGQVAASMAHDVPAPGEVSAPHPSHVPQPQYEAPPSAYEAPAPRAAAPGGDNPFSGSGMGGFDPNEGLFDAGPEIKPRGSKGLVFFAALIAAGVGGVGGWLGHKIVSTQDKIDSGHAKGEKMVAQVEKISDARKSVSLAMEDLKKEVATDPKAAADKVTALLTDAFDKQPQISELFGWQLASVDPAGVKATFQLYEQVTDLQTNLSLMAKILAGYGDVMKVGGPTLYGITFGPSGGQLLAVSDTLCGELPEVGEGETPSLEGLKPCGADAAKAVAYKVNDFSGDRIVPRGYGPGQAVLLLAEGKVYEYAIGIEQGNNAANFYKMALSRVDESLAEMDKAEEKALLALKKYAEDPNVDGSKSSNGDDG